MSNKRSIRAALKKVRVQTDTFDLPIEDGADEALQALQRANGDLVTTEYGGDKDSIARAKARLDEAKSVYESRVLRLVLKSIPPTDYAALEVEFPTDDTKPLLEDEFYFHLLAACVEDSDLTADEWRKYLRDGNISTGYANGLLLRATAVNVRLPSGDIPKS